MKYTFLRFPAFRSKAVTLSYDDGVAYDRKLIEIMRANGLRGTFNINGGRFATEPNQHRLTKEDALALYTESGMEVAKEFAELSPPQYYWSDYPRLFYLWGHSYEFNDDDNWSVIEEFAQYIGNREEIWYATNGELYDYVKAYEALRFSADGKTIHNPTAQTLWLNVCGTLCKVEAGETIRI